MTLSEIASSKKICEELIESGALLDTIKGEIKNITPENEKDEIFNIVKIGNRVVRFGADYDMPDFDNGEMAADVLELTFKMEKVDKVPFINAASYLLNISNFERMLEVCLIGFERFPHSIEIINKAMIPAESLGDDKIIKTLLEAKQFLFTTDSSAIAEEMHYMIMNWRTDEAKALVYNYADKGEVPSAAMLANLFWAYTLGFKDEKTELFAERLLALMKNKAEDYIKNSELAYQASMFFINNSRWQDSEIVINAYRLSGAKFTPVVLNQLLSYSIISKDKARVESALMDFYGVYNNDKNFFTDIPYTFANVSNCYALLQDKDKTLEYLNLAKSKQWDISYVKNMEDYKFIAGDKEFLSLF